MKTERGLVYDEEIGTNGSYVCEFEELPDVIPGYLVNRKYPAEYFELTGQPVEVVHVEPRKRSMQTSPYLVLDALEKTHTEELKQAKTKATFVLCKALKRADVSMATISRGSDWLLTFTEKVVGDVIAQRSTDPFQYYGWIEETSQKADDVSQEISRYSEEYLEDAEQVFFGEEDNLEHDHSLASKRIRTEIESETTELFKKGIEDIVDEPETREETLARRQNWNKDFFVVD